ncbi:MAG: cation:proton antiporter [Bdellovibrionales bacterium]|nr:cation:proton antiporter [Bdellovibrionales bacterium]
MPLLTSLLILIVAARLLGQVMIRLGQPALVGEMLAGVLLGPAVLNLVSPNEALSGITELAVFLVILSAGLEMDVKDLVDAWRSRGLVLAALSFLIPLLAGIAIGVIYRMDVMRTVFLGVCISITALPVAVRILESFKQLHTPIAKFAIGTAILNDVAALLVLGVMLNLPEQRSFKAIAGSVGVVGGKFLLLAGLIVGIGRLLEHVSDRGISIKGAMEQLVKLLGAEALFGVVVIFVLVFGSISEVLGFHFVIGAFFGALLLSRDFFTGPRFADLQKTLGSITGGFLAPLFFATIGLEFNLIAIHSVGFMVLVLVVSIVTKMAAGWLGGRFAGLKPREALALGAILNGRGVMELVVASIAYERGFIGQGLFSTLVLMGLVTTLITPSLFRQFSWIKARSRTDGPAR